MNGWCETASDGCGGHGLASMPTILIASAREDVHGLLARYYDRNQWRVVVARSPIEVVAQVFKFRPAAVLLYPELEEGGATTALDLLRATTVTSAVPVVAVTRGDRELVGELERIGLDARVDDDDNYKRIVAAVTVAVGGGGAELSA